MKTIYHLEFAKTGLGVSGGETSMIELINFFSSKGIRNVLLTTDNGKTAYSALFPGKTKVQYMVIQTYEEEKRFGFFISYLLRLRKIKSLLANIAVEKDALIICHSEFLPNSYGLKCLLKKCKENKFAAMYHMRSPRIFRGYEGEFTGKIQFPSAAIAHYKLTQVIYRKIIMPNVEIFTVNKFYEKYLNAKYPKNNVHVLHNYGGAVKVTSQKKVIKKYDLIWVGRFHAQKGLPDFIKTVAAIRVSQPSIKAVVVGGGNASYEAAAKKIAGELGVLDAIDFVGFLTGEEKEVYYERSRVFVMTSYYESFGQVILEAMSHGLPVAAYRLPVYDVFETGIEYAGLLDVEGLAAICNKLMTNKGYYIEKRRAALKESRRHSWELTGEAILSEFSK